MSSKRPIPLAIGIGAIAGLRTFTAPAAVGWAAHAKLFALHHSVLKFLKSRVSRNIILAFAAGELIADKLPSTPNRTDPGPLAARIVSGALCGAAIYSSAKQPIATGAALGGLGAIAGSFAGYEVRRRLGRKIDVPDAALALLEDVLAIGGGASIVSAA